jgi:SAM-dependent methyltransferase
MTATPLGVAPDAGGARPVAARADVHERLHAASELFVTTALHAHRTLIAIDAQHETSTPAALSRLPRALVGHPAIELLVVTDGGSADDASVARPSTMLGVPRAMPPGQRRKLVFDYAVRTEKTILLTLPPAGLDDPRHMFDLLAPILRNQADLVIGHDPMNLWRRRIRGLAGRVASWGYNKLLGAVHHDVRSTCRAMRVDAVRCMPFGDNADGARFDVELLIQFFVRGLRVAEVRAPHDLSPRERAERPRMRDVIASAAHCMMHQRGFLFHPRFDTDQSPYRYRADRYSTHRRVVDRIPAGSRVLDLGCGAGYVAAALRGKGCYVAGVDARDSSEARSNTNEFHVLDLNQLGRAAPRLELDRFDVVIALDVIEHLDGAERFLAAIRAHVREDCRVILSTANVAYWSMRLSLMLGRFNYGKRGILDVTHTRLFTPRTFDHVCRAAGYDTNGRIGVPPPVTDVIRGSIGDALTGMHAVLSGWMPALFGFQFIAEMTPRPTIRGLWSRCEIRQASRAGRAEFQPQVTADRAASEAASSVGQP